MFHKDRKTAEAVKRSHTGIHAKRLGDKMHTTPAWQVKKIDIMDNLVRLKLRNSDAARKALKATGEKEIIEDTTNAFWGRGTDNRGQNMLGKLWMLYRKKPSMFETKRYPNTRVWATREHQPRCYRCNEHGHLMEHCRQDEHLTCWNCGFSGHKRKHCRYFTNRKLHLSR